MTLKAADHGPSTREGARCGKHHVDIQRSCGVEIVTCPWQRRPRMPSTGVFEFGGSSRKQLQIGSPVCGEPERQRRDVSDVWRSP